MRGKLKKNNEGRTKAMILKGENIVCLASSQWDSPTWVNPQHLMDRLSKCNRVLYVEPISLRSPSMKKTDVIKIIYRIKGWFRGVKRRRERLWVFSPFIVPLHRVKLIRIANRILLRMFIRLIQKRLGLSNPILWVFLPTGVDLIGHLEEKLVVYHCVDQYSANPGVNGKLIAKLEDQILRKADLVFTTSRSLYEDKKASNANTFYLPNAADVRHFKKAVGVKIKVPDDLEVIPKPTAGFWGAISGYKVDVDLLAYAADKLPNVSFVLIGPIGTGDPKTDVSTLREKKNIYLLGPRPFTELPGYLKGFDVCMIPYILNETTANVFPMKLFEYLSAGKPVVSTDVPSMAEYKDYCRVVLGEDDFVDGIKRALNEKDETIRLRRVQLAEKHSWEENVAALSDLISERLRPKKRMT